MLEAATSSMRSAAGELRRAGLETQSLRELVAAEAADVRSVVADPAVAGAAAAALAAVASQLTVCAGGLEHAAAAVRGSANAYDEVDSSAAARLAGLGRAG